MTNSTKNFLEEVAFHSINLKDKIGAAFGSYGWGGRMVEQIIGMLSNLKVELLEPVIIKGFPKEEDFTAFDRLADEILEKHKDHNLTN